MLIVLEQLLHKIKANRPKRCVGTKIELTDPLSTGNKSLSASDADKIFSACDYDRIMAKQSFADFADYVPEVELEV